MNNFSIHSELQPATQRLDNAQGRDMLTPEVTKDGLLVVHALRLNRVTALFLLAHWAKCKSGQWAGEVTSLTSVACLACLLASDFSAINANTYWYATQLEDGVG